MSINVEDSLFGLNYQRSLEWAEPELHPPDGELDFYLNWLLNQAMSEIPRSETRKHVVECQECYELISGLLLDTLIAAQRQRYEDQPSQLDGMIRSALDRPQFGILQVDGTSTMEFNPVQR